MTTAIDKALDFVDRCANHNTLDALLTDFSDVVGQMGFKYFMMTGLPSLGEDVETLIIANKWPDGWTDRYREGRFFMDDPVSRSSFSMAQPFTWEQARNVFEQTARAAQIEGEAKEFGMVDGMGFPMFDPNNWQAVVSLAADTPVSLSRRESGVIYLASVMAQSQAAELNAADRAGTTELTPRERDVLTWMAHGKSNWETATILGISEGTVRIHLSSIRAKLSASNTTHAVARALRTRQISL